MGTIHQLRPNPGEVTLGNAIDAFLAEIHSPGTRRAYAGTLRAMAIELGEHNVIGILENPDGANPNTVYLRSKARMMVWVGWRAGS
jgi:hypothetical protein